MLPDWLPKPACIISQRYQLLVVVVVSACVWRGGEVGGWVLTRKAKVGVLNSTLKFYFGCFFQLQNRLQRGLQHKRSANAPLPTAIQE